MDESNYGPSPLTRIPLHDGNTPSWWTQELAQLSLRWEQPNPYQTWEQLWHELDRDDLLFGIFYLFHDDRGCSRLDPFSIAKRWEKGEPAWYCIFGSQEVQIPLDKVICNKSVIADVPIIVEDKL